MHACIDQFAGRGVSPVVEVHALQPDGINLLGNAQKFTSEGGFSLDIHLLDGDQGRDLCFDVFDTGRGISEEDQARLFTRFTQVDVSTGGPGGSGLGLAISKELAHLMGGDINLVSRRQHGSTFTLRIPLRPADTPVADDAPAQRIVRADSRILLAEDNEVNQLVAQRLLATLGYTNVVPVFTGREAVHACTEASFDLVLMDCQMPAMDGWEATRELRCMGIKAPVVAFTASATTADRDRCLAAGMNDYITKPVELVVLAEKIQRWLGEPGAPAALPDFGREAAEKRFLGDRELFARSRDLFVRQTRDALEEVDARAAEPVALQQLMHRIRGSAATVGAERLADWCRRIEEAPQPRREQLQGWVREVRVAFEVFVTESQALAEWATGCQRAAMQEIQDE